MTVGLRKKEFLIAAGEGGLSHDSIALCHQMRSIDTTRLSRRLGVVGQQTMLLIEDCVLYMLGIV